MGDVVGASGDPEPAFAYGVEQGSGARLRLAARVQPLAGAPGRREHSWAAPLKHYRWNDDLRIALDIDADIRPLGTIANACLLWAVQSGLLSVVSVLVALYPAVTVALAADWMKRAHADPR